MPLENHISAEKTRARLQDVSLAPEDESADFVFDPKAEISEAEWELIEEETKKEVVGFPDLFVSKIINLSLVDPDRARKNTTKAERYHLEEGLRRHSRGSDFLQFLEYTLGIALLDQAKAQSLITADDWENIKNLVERTSQEDPNDESDSSASEAVAILAIDRAKYTEIFAEKKWPWLKESIEKNRQTNDYGEIAREAFFIAELAPDELKKILTKRDWRGMRKKLEEHRDNSEWPAFIQLASSLVTIARVFQDQNFENTSKPLPARPQRKKRG